MCERELETEQNCNILNPTPMNTTAFLSCSPGLLNLGPGGPASLGASFLYRILYATDWTSCAPSNIIIQRPHSSCGRHKSHLFNPSTVKGIFWYSSTGRICYLHGCISYFDSPSGLEVNIQQSSLIYFSKFHMLNFLHVRLHHSHTHILQNNSPGQWLLETQKEITWTSAK